MTKSARSAINKGQDLTVSLLENLKSLGREGGRDLLKALSAEELVDHPIVNHFVVEVSKDMGSCPCDDCDPCDYEAGP